MGNTITPTEQEIMLERGQYEANGFVFDIEPVYYKEIADYERDVKVPLYPREETGLLKEEVTDEELATHGIAIFSYLNRDDTNQEQQSIYKRIKLWLVKHTSKRGKEYHSYNPAVSGIIKWIEKKIKYNGEHIMFDDLERKYKLSKSEIIKMFGYFEYLSFFQ